MKDCIFCSIANKEIPAKIMYEDDVCLAFLDLSQTTNGHTLVIPKQHFKDFLEVNTETLTHIMAVTKQLANTIVIALDATGCNILTNAGTDAGQTVMHFHVHIIPRYHGNDTLNITLSDRSSEVDLEQIYNKIQLKKDA